MERPLEALPNNLLGNLTPLIGRDDVLAEIASLLEHSRLVTLVGTGGIGKTRTALQVADDMLRGDTDGVWFVDLAPLEDPLLVAGAIAEVFNISDEGGSRSLIERVAVAIKQKRLLIVLDNCEHLIEAAAEAADHLLRTCPGVRILATSREPLGITGEEPYRMPALSVPPERGNTTAASVLEYGAVALFVARARSAQRSFTLTDENAPLVADIVRRLDGIALAIELAAPRIKVLGIQELDKRLDERFKLLSGGSRFAPPRQKTLRALIGWSYDLLNEAERSLLRQIAIFRGAWTLEAAGNVCIDERFADWDVLNLLSSLVDKSLVGVEGEGDGRRYRLLESTRQFAADQLDEADERDHVSTRHCRYFSEVAQRASDKYWRMDSDLWIVQVRRDVENYRAAIDWGLAGRGDAALAATIVAGLRALWLATARNEGRAHIERAGSVLAVDAPARVRGLLALASARLGYSSARATESVSAAVRAFRDGADDIVRVEAITFQGYALGRAGELAEAVALFNAALELSRTTHAPRLIAWVLSIAAYWIGASGDHDRARALFDEAAELLRGCDDRRALARLQSHRAEFLFSQNDLADALACVREAASIYRDREDEANASGALLNAAAYLLASGRLDEAHASAREGLDLVLRAFDDDYWVAISIGHLAHLAAETGDARRAARLLGYVDAVYQKVGSTREYTEQRGYDRALELIRASIPDDRLGRLMSEGSTMERDGAIAEALAIPYPPASSGDAAGQEATRELLPSEHHDSGRDRILDSVVRCAVPIVALIAPAGFGKTRVATAYAARFGRRAHVTVSREMTALDVLSLLSKGLGDDPDGRDFGSTDAVCRHLWGSQGQTCLVVDSLERLDNQTILEILTFLTRSRPESGILVVCSRREPPSFQFTDLVEPHLLAVFRRPDLELSIDQLRAMTPNNANVSLARLYGIYQVTRGWPVPSSALLTATARGAFDGDALHYDHPAIHDLLDWVDKNVIAVLPEDLREVLLHCVACPDSVPADFDATYGDDPNRPDRRLYRNSQRADIGFAGEIAVHPLVAFTLRARHAAALEQSARVSAAAFIEQGKPLRAARALIGIGDAKGAAQILDTVDFETAANFAGFAYPGLSLEHYARSKPPFERYPLLWFNLVPCRFYVIPAESLAQEGASILRDHGDDLPPRLQRWITAIVSVLFVEGGDLHTAEKYAAQLRQLDDAIDAVDGADTAEMYLDVARGGYESALDRWRRVSLRLQSSPVWHAFHLRCSVRAQMRMGNLDAGIDSLRALLSSLHMGGCPSLAGFGAMEAAFISWHRGDIAAFKQYRREFARIVQHYDVPGLWRGLCATFGEDIDIGRTPVQHRDVLSALMLAADESDPERGLTLALQAVVIADRGADSALKIAARAVAATHGAPNAEELMAQAAAIAETMDSEIMKASVAAFGAGAAGIGLLQKHIDSVRAATTHATSTEANMPGFRKLVVDIATGEITRGAGAVKVSEGTSQLLMLLAANGATSRDGIIDRLWPDLDGDSAVNALKMCVHRARQQLGDPSIIAVRKATYSLGTEVESTYAHILECATAATQPLSERQRAEYEDVFDRLTRGMTTGQAPWPWFQQYAKVLLDAMRRIGGCIAEDELERGDPQTALQLARRMTSADPFDENARGLVIRAYGKAGNWTAAIQEFRDFGHMLKRDMDAEPSERLRRLLEVS